MAKTIGIFIGLGSILALLIGIVTISFGSWRLFLLLSVIGAVVAFVPLIIAVFTSKSMPKPTLYGTSAPGRWTTVQAKEEGKPTNFEWPVRLACLGVPLLVAFFIFSMLV